MNARKLRTFASTSLRAALLLQLVAGPLVLSAATVSISAVVPDPNPPQNPTIVIFKGLAYPQSQVTLMNGGSVVATVPADPAAKFQVQISGLATGIYNFSLFAEDALGRVGRTTSFALSITQGTTTTVSGIFLGPTIQANGTSFDLDDTISLIGATAPNSQVTIFVSSEEEQTFSATADASGLWVKQMLGTQLGEGSHSARAKAVSATSEISGFSNTVSFSISQSAPQPCDGKSPGDLNCDGRVNLQDFSILLFFWKQTNPSNPRADINGSGQVTIQDLSILLFWWTG